MADAARAMNTTSSLFQKRTTHGRAGVPISWSERKARAAAKVERERQKALEAEAVLEFEEMVRNSIAKREQQIASWRAAAKSIDLHNAWRRAGIRWLRRTREARIAGPFQVPTSVAELCSTIEAYKLDKSPRGAVVAFLLAAIERNLRRTRKGKRKRDSEMLAATLHPECTMDPGESSDPHASSRGQRRRVVRKYSIQKLQSMSEETLRSYAVGSTPDNGYSFDPSSVQFKIDNIASKAGPWATPTEGATVDVFMFTNGAPPLHPESRACQVKCREGKWYVRKFDKLCGAVREPIGTVDELTEVPTTPERHDSKSEPRSLFIAAGTVNSKSEKQKSDEAQFVYTGPAPPSAHERFQTGLTGPVFSTRKRQNREEKPEQRAERHRQAAHHTSDLASFLANKEMYRRWAEHPSMLRRLIDLHGSEHVVNPDLRIIQQMLKAYKRPHAGEQNEESSPISASDCANQRQQAANVDTLSKLPTGQRRRNSLSPTKSSGGLVKRASFSACRPGSAASANVKLPSISVGDRLS